MGLKPSGSSGVGLERSCVALPGKAERVGRPGPEDGSGSDWMRQTETGGGVELLEAWFHGPAYNKHRHDTYGICVTDRGVQAFTYREHRPFRHPGRDGGAPPGRSARWLRGQRGGVRVPLDLRRAAPDLRGGQGACGPGTAAALRAQPGRLRPEVGGGDPGGVPRRPRRAGARRPCRAAGGGAAGGRSANDGGGATGPPRSPRDRAGPGVPRCRDGPGCPVLGAGGGHRADAVRPRPPVPGGGRHQSVSLFTDAPAGCGPGADRPGPTPWPMSPWRRVLRTRPISLGPSRPPTG